MPSGEPALTFLSSRIGGLDVGLLELFLASPSSGASNPLLHLYLPVLSLTLRGRLFLADKAACLKYPGTGGLPTWKEEEGRVKDPAVAPGCSPTSLPSHGVVFFALLCLAHWARLRDRTAPRKEFSAAEFRRLRTLWKAVGV